MELMWGDRGSDGPSDQLEESGRLSWRPKASCGDSGGPRTDAECKRDSRKWREGMGQWTLGGNSNGLHCVAWTPAGLGLELGAKWTLAVVGPA